jgi:hypothetical protein
VDLIDFWQRNGDNGVCNGQRVFARRKARDGKLSVAIRRGLLDETGFKFDCEYLRIGSGSTARGEQPAGKSAIGK